MPIELAALREELADRYAIERELGAGGTAVVYLATDLRHGREVAIKVLRPDLAVSLGAERFLREIEIAAGLVHPHIVPVYDSGQAAGYLYYVMPHVVGETLRDLLQREGVLPLEEVQRIASEVAGALEYAHERGLVHRDIKPENILLSAGHASVADFGLARAIEQSGGERLTQTGVVVGSPIYSSPEQGLSDGRLDGRADLYSLAAVVYEMLSGEPPFSGPSARVILTRKAKGAPTPLRTLRESVPVHVESAVMRGLARLPADRFRSVREFQDALIASRSVGLAPRPAQERSAGHEPTFWSELKRRHVYHTAVVYAGVAWVLVEVSGTTFPYLNLPDRAVTVIIGLAIAGFPVAVVLAWVYEITRDGIRRTQAVPLERDSSGKRPRA